MTHEESAYTDLKSSLASHDFQSEIGAKLPSQYPFNPESVRALLDGYEQEKRRAEAAERDMKDVFKDTPPYKYDTICDICIGCVEKSGTNWCNDFKWRGVCANNNPEPGGEGKR